MYMKILAMSDSHSGLRFMRLCIERLKPQQVIHLGDLYEDAQVMQEEFPYIRFHMVPGNCDSYLIRNREPAVLCYDIDGVRLMMTHGHLHGVKSGFSRLIADARQMNAQGVLFGHTHEKLSYREEDGLWIINPGSCRSDHGSVALLETADGKISACAHLTLTDILEL
jgi:putative phosphoesterase